MGVPVIITANTPAETVDAVPAVGSLRTLGGGTQQASPGNHDHTGVYVLLSNDGNYAHLAGIETVTGAKTFSVPIIGSVSASGAQSSPAYLPAPELLAQGKRTGKANPDFVMYRDGRLSISNNDGPYTGAGHHVGAIAAGDDYLWYIEQNRDAADILKISFPRFQVTPVTPTPGAPQYSQSYTPVAGGSWTAGGALPIPDNSKFSLAGGTAAIQFLGVTGLISYTTIGGPDAFGNYYLSNTHDISGTPMVFNNDSTARRAFMVTDQIGAPIFYLNNIGGAVLTDNFVVSAGVFSNSYQIGFQYLDNASRNHMCLVFNGDNATPTGDVNVFSDTNAVQITKSLAHHTSTSAGTFDQDYIDPFKGIYLRRVYTPDEGGAATEYDRTAPELAISNNQGQLVSSAALLAPNGGIGDVGPSYSFSADIGTGMGMTLSGGLPYLNLFVNGTNQWRINNGGALYPISSGTQDIGATSQRVANVFVDHVVAGFATVTTGGIVQENSAVDASGGARTPALPTAVGRTGQRFTVYKSDSGGNTVTVGTTSAQTINSPGSSATTRVLTAQNNFLTVLSDGAKWIVVGSG